jgi:membrane protease YdiL (CAAX protease family)
LGFAAASRCRTISSHTPRQRATQAGLAGFAGIALGLILLATLFFLAQREPALHARFAGRLHEPWWRSLALAFESSILEEVVFRLFTMSVIAWAASRLLPRSALVIALATSALLFGLAHLPAWLTATHATPGLVAAVLLLNGAGGLLFGWLYWRSGLPYAIVCHFFGDIVVQALGPRLLA